MSPRRSSAMPGNRWQQLCFSKSYLTCSGKSREHGPARTCKRARPCLHSTTEACHKDTSSQASTTLPTHPSTSTSLSCIHAAPPVYFPEHLPHCWFHSSRAQPRSSCQSPAFAKDSSQPRPGCLNQEVLEMQVY